MAAAWRLRSLGLPIARRLIAAGQGSAFSAPAAAISQDVRFFATQTKQPVQSKIMPPLALYGGTGNYASALFIAAAQSNVLERVETEVLTLVEASKNSPLFLNFVNDLSLPRETRVKVIIDLFKEAGFSDVTKNFLAILAENGRLKYLERIAKRFVDLTMAHRGEVKVVVTSVIPLPEEEEKELKHILQDILGKGKTIKLEQKIDPSIIGGLMVEFDQKVLDLSIKTRAKQIESYLREPLF